MAEGHGAFSPETARPVLEEAAARQAWTLGVPR